MDDLRTSSLTTTNYFVMCPLAAVTSLMKKPPVLPPPKPTDAELRILRALWLRRCGTVREIMDDLNRAQPTGYTTVLKLMQIMTEKGLLRREEEGRQHLYRPAFTQAHTQRQLVSHLLDRAFGGSARNLVLQALAAQPASPKELAEIRRLIHQMETERTTS